MNRTLLLTVVVACVGLLFASTTQAKIPAPPVNQYLGMTDVSLENASTADCRVCHPGANNFHHAKYDTPVDLNSIAPGTPSTDGTYRCLTCHNEVAGTPFRRPENCSDCHNGPSPHHTTLDNNGDTVDTTGGQCNDCHGLVENQNPGGIPNGGHYIPTYDPSLVTPYPSRDGDGEYINPGNDLGPNGEGSCEFCHDSGTEPGISPEPDILVQSNKKLHHGTGLYDAGKCSWCHVASGPSSDPGADMRRCESCHGPDSLHNIQANSDDPINGTVFVVGGELVGFGHVGRDNGIVDANGDPDSDCWGCHGFNISGLSVAPGSGPIIPSLYGADTTVIRAGTDTMVVLSGAAFTNKLGDTLYESEVRLTAADGTSATLTPEIIVDEGKMAITIPADTAPGNYHLRATKEQFASNPVRLVVLPEVNIRTVRAFKDTVAIYGSGFGGHLAGAGTVVTGEVTGKGDVEGTIVSWTDTRIVANFDAIPDKLTVDSVFGSATSNVESSKDKERASKERRTRRSRRPRR